MSGKRVLTTLLILAFLTMSFPTNRAAAAVIIVDSTVDEWDAGSCATILPSDLPGPGGETSLREAMCAANNNPGEDTINFAIPGAGVHTILPTDSLPVLTDDYTIIDGYTQAGSSPATETTPAVLQIEIDCSLLVDHNCLEMSSAHNRISGLVINGADWYGIGIGYSTAAYNQVSGNFIGLEPDGLTASPNDTGGVVITEGANHNYIGGTIPADRNIISGNGYDGVSIWGNNSGDPTIVNYVLGNTIGMDASGEIIVPNLHNGVRIYGNSNNNTVALNIITGNGYHGVMLAGEFSSNNLIAANWIGLTADGLSAPGNFYHGMVIENGAHHNTIGGDEEVEGNVISGNGNYGILIMDEGSDLNLLFNNLIGTGLNGSDINSYQQHGVVIVSGPDNNVVAGGIIAHHSINGILVYNDVGVSTIGNKLNPFSIYDNGYGIDLDGEGANGNILPPEITQIVRDGGNIVIEGTAEPEQTIFIYVSTVNEGQGRTLVGWAEAGMDYSFSYTGPIVNGLYFNATATTETEGTSEFSATYEFPIFGIFLPYVSR